MRTVPMLLMILVCAGCQKSDDVTKGGESVKSADPVKSADLPKNSDAESEKALIGAWDETRLYPDGSVLEGRRIFLEGGRLNMTGVYTEGKPTSRRRSRTKKATLIASGTWKVKDGHLHYTIEKSNIPKAVPDGFTTADKIVKVTESEFVYHDSRLQRTLVATRVK